MNDYNEITLIIFIIGFLLLILGIIFYAIESLSKKSLRLMITGSIFIIIGFIFTIPIIISKYKSKKRNEEKEKVYDEIEKKVKKINREIDVIEKNANLTYEEKRKKINELNNEIINVNNNKKSKSKRKSKSKIKEKSKEEKIIELEDDIKNLKEIINFKEKDIKANPNISNLYIPSLNEKKEELKKSENELKILNSN